MEELAKEPRTMIIYESPRRIVKTLEQICELFGEERRVSACREISKIHEESVRGTAKEVMEHFINTEPKGEFVLIVSGCSEVQNRTKKPDEMGKNQETPIRESKYQRKMREREEQNGETVALHMEA